MPSRRRVPPLDDSSGGESGGEEAEEDQSAGSGPGDPSSDDEDNRSDASSENEDLRDARAKAEAGEAFAEMIINLWLDGATFTAQTVCVLCYWVVMGGLGGFAHELAYPPNRGSSKYDRRLKKVLKSSYHDDRLQRLDVPGY